MNLAKWLKSSGLKQGHFAGCVELSRAQLQAIMAKRRKASPAAAKRIERATGGAVKAHTLMSRQNAALAAKGAK